MAQNIRIEAHDGPLAAAILHVMEAASSAAASRIAYSQHFLRTWADKPCGRCPHKVTMLGPHLLALPARSSAAPSVTLSVSMASETYGALPIEALHREVAMRYAKPSSHVRVAAKKLQASLVGHTALIHYGGAHKAHMLSLASHIGGRIVLMTSDMAFAAEVLRIMPYATVMRGQDPAEQRTRTPRAAVAHLGALLALSRCERIICDRSPEALLTVLWRGNTDQIHQP